MNNVYSDFGATYTLPILFKSENNNIIYNYLYLVQLSAKYNYIATKETSVPFDMPKIVILNIFFY